MYRLGVPVKLLGAPLRSHDSRRWQNAPHLSVSLAYLRDTLDYLAAHSIRFYRLADQLAPYSTHPDLPQFHSQVAECATELAAIGDQARACGIRLTLHPAAYVQLGSPDSARVERSAAELEVAAALLDAMGAGPESVLVVHIGGVYGDARRSRERFAAACDRLGAAVRRRLTLENDDRHYSLLDALWVHQRTGVRLVLDLLHHRCFAHGGATPTEALALALNTWPPGQQPKVHFSSPRTEVRAISAHGRVHLAPPLPNQHSDFVHPFEFIDFLTAARAAGLRPFDIMVEAKAKELAVLRLRQQVAQYAPALAPELA